MPEFSSFQFAEVVLPLYLEGTFTYEIPKELQSKIQFGQRVAVAFGTRKLYTAIVAELHNNKPELYKTKPIVALLDEEPLVTKTQYDFWKWLAQYYVCTIGEVYRNAFPSALKLESETIIKLNPNKEISLDIFDENELIIIQNLQQKTSISLKELEAFLALSKIITTVKGLYEEGFIELDEKLVEKYSPKQIAYIKKNEALAENENLWKETIESLQRSRKQLDVLMQFLALEKQLKKPISKKELIEITESNVTTIKALLDKNILQQYYVAEERLRFNSDKNSKELALSKSQHIAYQQIKKSFVEDKAALLFGVTSSGKTEIYFQLITDAIENQQTTLFLLPEIAITTQLITRLTQRFGNEVGVYHSKLNSQERVEVYKNTFANKYKVIIGARSALFLPFQQLGLIVVDEEHDSSYKQTDVKPFYHARDAALYLAKLHCAQIVLGSATPSMESFYNANIKKYNLVTLTERFGNVQLPEIQLINLRETNYQLQMNGNFSFVLIDEIQKNLEAKKQVIIFQNRRGYAPIFECNTCGFTPQCPNCDVSLTYHKVSKELKCHYCGYKIAEPKHCFSCHSSHFNYNGLGTQQIEEELLALFPKANIHRMDADTMRAKHAYEKLFDKMQSQEIDILIGTQMVTKGLDFENVQLVAVLRGDSLLYLPDFRSEERAYQLLEQVSGRAGRRAQGKVMIQTFSPEHIVFQSVLHHSYESFAKHTLSERKQYNYPPFCKIVMLTFKHKTAERALKMAQYISKGLEFVIEEKYILGPEKPNISRINNLYIYHTMIKIPSEINSGKVKNWLQQLLKTAFAEVSSFKNVKVTIEVDYF